MIVNTYLYKPKLQATEKIISRYAEILRNDPDLQKLIDEYTVRKAHYDYMVKCPKKKVNAHLFNRYGNSHHGFYSYYHVGNNLEEMKANAIATTYDTDKVVDIVDRETGEILVVVCQGFVTYEA